jgi:hypothetical protein
MEFRTLRKEEIQVRPTDTKSKGKATLLLYQDARCAMDILDETVGGANWQKEYYEVKGNVYCKIGILTDNGWVWKADCGTESNVDAEKGEASDAFKRAAVCWGIGRELYSTPKVRINCQDSYYWNDKMTMTFTVKEISWDEKKELKSLIIVDKFGNEVYNYKGTTEVKEEERSNCDILKEFCSMKKKEEGVDKDELLKFFNFYCPKMGGWDHTVQPDKLWKRWMETKK